MSRITDCNSPKTKPLAAVTVPPRDALLAPPPALFKERLCRPRLQAGRKHLHRVAVLTLEDGMGLRLERVAFVWQRERILMLYGKVQQRGRLQRL